MTGPMTTKISPNALPARRFASDEERLAAFRARNPAADGHFIVAVKTTGIYCRPTCPARPPKRENIRFFNDIDAARGAGFRACKRCRPDGLSLKARVEAVIRRAEALADESDETLKVADLAYAMKMSEAQLLRLFKTAMGMTPKQFLLAFMTDRLRKNLRRGGSVTHAIQDAGFASFSRAYEAGKRLGIRPADIRKGGEALDIRIAAQACELGFLAIGVSDRGLCALTFGNSRSEALEAVRGLYRKARFVEDQRGLSAALDEAARVIAGEATKVSLPMDIRGTVFQEKVWKALTRIPLGETRSYADVARSIGHPAAHRAVAQACGANRIAVLLPCHRVTGSDGRMGGYAYGVERKQALLKKERARR